MSIWEQLGIEPTNDIRQIKRAYASKSKLVHPEEHPEEFRQLHEAYESAILYAKFKRSGPPQQSVPVEKPIEKPSDENKFDFVHEPEQVSSEGDTDSTEDETQFDFTKVHSVEPEIKEEKENFDFQKAIFQSELRRNNKIMEMTESVIRNAENLYHSKLFDTELQWLDVFNNDLAEQIINEPIFINELCSFLKTHKINENMANALFKVFHLVELIGIQDKGNLEELFNIIVSAKGEAFNRLEMKIKLFSYFTAISIILMFVFFAVNMYPMTAVMLFAFAILLAVVIHLKARRKNFYV